MPANRTLFGSVCPVGADGEYGEFDATPSWTYGAGAPHAYGPGGVEKICAALLVRLVDTWSQRGGCGTGER